MSTLTGNVTGTNRRELEAAAKDRATAYYGTQCVAVTLTSETENDDARSYCDPPTYRADYTATIKHRAIHRSSNTSGGYRKCANCGAGFK